MISASNVAAILESRISERCQRVGAQLKSAPDLVEATIGGLPSASLYSRVSGGEAQETPALPSHRWAWRLAPLPQTLLVVDLDLNGSTAESETRAFLWWLAVVRAGLSAVERADLCAFAIVRQDGPEMRETARQLERDERFCRKYACCLNLESDISKQLDAFLDRTFIAQPWYESGSSGPESLDPFRSTAETLTDRKVGLSLDEAEKWLSILATPYNDNMAGLAEALLAAGMPEKSDAP